MKGQCYSFEGMIPVIHPTAFVHPTAVLIGDVRIGPGCYIGPGASLRADFSSVIVGAGCNIQDYCILHGTPGFHTVVEDNGHIGHGAVVHGCTIRRNGLVGMNSAIYDGAVIGENSIVAAMAFVPAGTVIPPGHLAAGIPAKVVRALSEGEIARKTRGTEAYQKLAAKSLESFRPCEPLSEPEPGRDAMDPSAIWPEDLTRHKPKK
ncbi:putative hexapeptide repeat acetyltransferase [Candidatus Terasakiella magnetica]|nr:putative hexapeptide repeat acetyltransferase [Candidatus Terasakiella magnetica]